MFKNRKTKVVFQPQKEIVVVDEPVVTLEKSHEEIIGINSAAVESRYKDLIMGVVIDYNEVEYDFEWDAKNFRLARLSGEKVSPVTWQLASDYLTKFFTPKPAPKPIKKEPPVTIPVIEKIVEKVVAPVEEKKTPPIIMEEELDNSDDDLAMRAKQLLQQLGGNNLDLEYMEL